MRQLRLLDWMDAVTKERAIRKANAIEYKSGYPTQLFNDTWMKRNWGFVSLPRAYEPRLARHQSERKSTRAHRAHKVGADNRGAGPIQIARRSYLLVPDAGPGRRLLRAEPQRNEYVDEGSLDGIPKIEFSISGRHYAVPISFNRSAQLYRLRDGRRCRWARGLAPFSFTPYFF